jgi:hypothetical protein
MIKRILLATLLATGLTIIIQAQVPNVDANDSFAWNQAANSLAEAQGYVYKYYLDGAGVGSTFAGVTCSGTASPFTCQARTPAFSNGNHSLTITAASAAGESAPSIPFGFVFGNPPTTPNNIRVIRAPGATTTTTPSSTPKPTPPAPPSIK